MYGMERRIGEEMWNEGGGELVRRGKEGMRVGDEMIWAVKSGFGSSQHVFSKKVPRKTKPVEV